MGDNRITTDKNTTASDAVPSAAFFLPENVGRDQLRKYNVGLACTSDGTAKIQANNSPAEDITANPNDNWEDWSLGDQVLTAGNAISDFLKFPPTALRIVPTSGSFEMHVRGDLT